RINQEVLLHTRHDAPGRQVSFRTFVAHLSRGWCEVESMCSGRFLLPVETERQRIRRTNLELERSHQALAEAAAFYGVEPDYLASLDPVQTQNLRLSREAELLRMSR